MMVDHPEEMTLCVCSFGKFYSSRLALLKETSHNEVFVWDTTSCQ